MGIIHIYVYIYCSLEVIGFIWEKGLDQYKLKRIHDIWKKKERRKADSFGFLHLSIDIYKMLEKYLTHLFICLLLIFVLCFDYFLFLDSKIYGLFLVL